MTSQVLLSKVPSDSNNVLAAKTQSKESISAPESSGTSADRDTLSRSMKLHYQASHQVELLHLQADIDALLQQLQSLKNHRPVTTDS